MKEAGHDVSHVASATATVAVAPRVAFVDWLRFVAALQMLQGHTIAAVLAPAYRHGALYEAWLAARGLTSVAFLFASGMAFYFVAVRRNSRSADDQRGVTRRVRRALWLVMLGYLLHLPLAAFFASDATVRALALRGFLGVDVLQCIGVSMLTLEALRRVLPTRSHLAATCAVLAVGLLALTPLAARLAQSISWPWLSAYLARVPGSSFPLFPWAAHVFFGVACGAWLDSPSRLRTPTRIALLAVLLSSVFWMLSALGAASPVVDHVLRLSRVTLACSALAWLAAQVGRTPMLIQELSKQTLFLYVFHVLLVYGQGVGLAESIGPRLSGWAAVGLAALVVAVSAGLVLGYRGRQERRLAVAVGTG